MEGKANSKAIDVLGLLATVLRRVYSFLKCPLIRLELPKMLLDHLSFSIDFPLESLVPLPKDHSHMEPLSPCGTL